MTNRGQANARLHKIASRLPIVARYEQRIDDLFARNDVLARQVEMLVSDSSTLRTNPGGEFVPPGHFYSAVPNVSEATPRHEALMRQDAADIPGVDLGLAQQWALLERLEAFLPTMPFSDQAGAGLRYGFVNGAYSYGDATMLHLMLRWLRPANLIEVGSGHSSACTLDTIDQFLDGECEVTFIEPYDELLRSLITNDDQQRVRIVPSPVQDVPVDTFGVLGDGDLLFIDSTHVSKVGSDVNYLFFEVLPSLKPGVVVHIHDVFPRFEYPWVWIEQGRAWQEDYLLRAFLQFNNEFEVLFWPSLLAVLAPEEMFARFPTMQRNPGGSIYLRRRGGSPRL